MNQKKPSMLIKIPIPTFTTYNTWTPYKIRHHQAEKKVIIGQLVKINLKYIHPNGNNDDDDDDDCIIRIPRLQNSNLSPGLKIETPSSCGLLERPLVLKRSFVGLCCFLLKPVLIFQWIWYF